MTTIAAVGEAEQHDVPVLVEHVVDDVLDVRAERDLRAREVHALADARQARREHLVAGRLQAAPYVAEAVGAGPGAVDEDERAHAGIRTRAGFAHVGAPGNGSVIAS